MVLVGAHATIKAREMRFSASMDHGDVDHPKALTDDKQPDLKIHGIGAAAG